MSDKTQKTPQGKESPVPKRGEFIANLKKVSKPKKPKREESTPDSPEEGR